MSKPLNLLDKNDQLVRSAESLTDLLRDYEAKQGDYVILCEVRKRDYILSLPHLEGVVVMKGTDNIFLNEEPVLRKRDSRNEVWRGVYPHPKGIMTIIDEGYGKKQLVLFRKNGQRETLATFYGEYHTKEHPALLGVLINVGNRILLNGIEVKEWENENIHGLAHKLERDIKRPPIHYHLGKVWVERTAGARMEVCTYSLDRGGSGCHWYLDRGVIVERSKKIVLYLIEKED